MLLPAIAEHKQRAAFRIFAEALLGGGPQPIEAGAQITRRRGHENFEMRLEAQHGVAWERTWSSWAASSICPASVIRTRADEPNSITSPARAGGGDSSTCTKSGAGLVEAWRCRQLQKVV